MQCNTKLNKNKYQISWHPTIFRGNLAFYTPGWRTFEFENLSEICPIITKYCWSPIVWKDGIRNSENFMFADLCALDHDDDEITLDCAVHNHYCDFKHIIGTTHHHGVAKGKYPAADRFRFVTFFDHRITDPDKYSYNMEFYTQDNFADKTGKDGGRFFKPCRKIVSIDEDDDCYTQPVKRMTKKVKRQRAKLELLKGKFNSEWVERTLSELFEDNEKNTTCYRLGCEAGKAGIQIEEMVERILQSPSYKDTYVSERLYKEIFSAVRNGFNKTYMDRGD